MLAVSVRPMQIGRMLAGEQAATLASPVLRHSPSRLPRKPESLARKSPERGHSGARQGPSRVSLTAGANANGPATAGGAGG